MPTGEPVLTSARRAFAAALVSAALSGSASGEEARLLLVGDVLLSRQVEVEIARTGRDPWGALRPLLAESDLVAGNLEGAVGKPGECVAAEGPCFAVAPGRIALLASAGFAAMSVENNHAGDLGEAGRTATRRALLEAGIRPLSREGGPSFFRVRGRVVAFVALNLVGGPGAEPAAGPSPELRRQLRLARSLAEVVVVSVHWGEELLDWPSARQRQLAAWLVENGATVVAGHHPHVVQPAGCVGGRPVFYSLGNHLFDQKYPETKEGAIADCRIGESSVTCAAIATRTGSGTFRPEPAGPLPATALAACQAPLHAPLRIGETVLRPAATDADALVLEGVREGRVAFRSRPVRALSAERLPAEGEGPLLLTLERHLSPIDGEEGVRPYVYSVGPRGLEARWRGSALAWPLVDATVLPGTGLVCALHRGDSFLTLEASSLADRAALYRWNGFGFSGAADPDGERTCQAVWGLPARRSGTERSAR